MSDPWAIVLRPLMALLLFGSAFFIADALRRFIPPGRVKSALYTRYPVIPEGPVSPRVMWAWRVFFAVLVLLVIFKPFRYL